VGVPRIITPANPVACPNDVKNYTCGASGGATGYNWTVPVGCTITSGDNTNSIQVGFPNPYTGAPPVGVSATSACGSSVARCKTVGSNIPIQPGTMSGPTTNICNSTVQYSISNVTGATSYTWTNPAGTTISSGQGSTTILLSVSSSFNKGTLKVVANTTLCTLGTSAPRTITIYGKPNTPSAIIASPATWCNGGFVNFTVVAVVPVAVVPVAVTVVAVVTVVT
jgi:large repetitive protein